MCRSCWDSSRGTLSGKANKGLNDIGGTGVRKNGACVTACLQAAFK